MKSRRPTEAKRFEMDINCIWTRGYLVPKHHPVLPSQAGFLQSAHKYVYTPSMANTLHPWQGYVEMYAVAAVMNAMPTHWETVLILQFRMNFLTKDY